LLLAEPCFAIPRSFVHVGLAVLEHAIHEPRQSLYYVGRSINSMDALMVAEKLELTRALSSIFFSF